MSLKTSTLKLKYEGKRVRVRTMIEGHPRFIVGNCTFIGFNKMIPSYGLQITVDRFPITNIKESDIELI